jgi:hypothetical protein
MIDPQHGIHCAETNQSQAMKKNNRQRCEWPGDDPLMVRYHDEEWGVPVHDDRKWFEFIVLDAFQAGLSWRTVLHKRKAFHQVFLVSILSKWPGCLKKPSPQPLPIRQLSATS